MPTPIPAIQSDSALATIIVWRWHDWGLFTLTQVAKVLVCFFLITIEITGLRRVGTWFKPRVINDKEDVQMSQMSILVVVYFWEVACTHMERSGRPWWFQDLLISCCVSLFQHRHTRMIERLKSSHGWSIPRKQITAAQLFPWIILGNRKRLQYFCGSLDVFCITSYDSKWAGMFEGKPLFSCHWWLFVKSNSKFA